MFPALISLIIFFPHCWIYSGKSAKNKVAWTIFHLVASSALDYFMSLCAVM